LEKGPLHTQSWKENQDIRQQMQRHHHSHWNPMTPEKRCHFRRAVREQRNQPSPVLTKPSPRSVLGLSTGLS
jgi:hypothetical protein